GRGHQGEVPLDNREVVILASRGVGREGAICDPADVQLGVADEEELAANGRPGGRGQRVGDGLLWRNRADARGGDPWSRRLLTRGGGHARAASARPVRAIQVTSPHRVSAGPGRALGPTARCTQRGGSKSIRRNWRNTRAKS